jgi:long-chain acyl-CoA synthetase
MHALQLPPGFRPLTVGGGIRAAATREPGKPAILFEGRQRNYGQLVEAMNRVANAALGLGLTAGHNAALIAPNSLEYVEIVAGISDMGGAVATPNPKLTAQELADICNDAQAELLFIHPDCAPALDRALLRTVRHVVVLGADYDALLARAASHFTPPNVPEWAVFSIPYTSGTTGKPKGVMLPHRSRTLAFLSYAAEYGIYSPDDHYLAFAPMCHGAGLAFAMAALFVGGTLEILPKFEPELVLRAVHSGRVTGMFTVPTHYHAIFDLEHTLLETLRGNRLRGIVANAAPLPQAMKERIVDYFGTGLLHETYGSTEAGVVSNLRPKDQLRKIHCVGQPFIGNQVRLLGEDGSEVAAGEVGELFSTSPCLFAGYWGNTAATREAYRSIDGAPWVSVGDLARRDDEGHLYIVDRKKDMVITGAVNVYPREVEAIIDQHPAVLESAVFGVPDARWGELLVAAVVPTPGARLQPEALLDWLKPQMAAYKCPKQVLLLPALPRNANGKVLKRELRASQAPTAAAPSESLPAR